METKKAWNSTYLNRGTGTPNHDKRAHARVREPIYLSSRGCEITSFLFRDSKRKLQIFSIRRIAKLLNTRLIYKKILLR